MARPLTAPNPLDTLEDAFDVLQSCTVATWLRYLVGAAPLMVGLLFVWDEFSSAAGSGDDPVIASLLLVALLVWFYHCRQIFAGHLRRNLGLTPADGGKKRLGFALACFEGTRLLAVPVAVLSVFPVAWTTAFYRSLTVFAGEGLSPRDALAKAARAAFVWQRENWFALAILNLLGLVVFIDVALTVIVAPMLVRIFTGYESAFTQRGVETLGIQLPIILALTWLCFDPLLQAVYTVRSFQWEGLRTGEDLLIRLKRIAPLLLLLAISALRLHAAPLEPTLSREGLNRSIDQTLQSQDYKWRNPPPAEEAGKKDWFIDSVDHIVAFLNRTWKAVSDLWSDVLDWIGKLLRGTVPSLGETKGGQPAAVRPIFYLVGILIAAVAIVLIWKFGPRKVTPPAAIATSPAVDLNNEGLLASDLPEDEWLRMAEGYANSGDLRLALRALYLGTLALLNHRGLLTVHACKSNRDYEGELRRRSRDAGLTQIFRQNIRSFEQSWYGFHEVTGDQLQSFRDNLGRLRSGAV